MTFREKLASSRWARAVALPGRARYAWDHVGTQVSLAGSWLVTSREHHNFTYDLTSRNLSHLAWWVSTVTGAPIAECQVWINEAVTDQNLQAHVSAAVQNSARKGLADRHVRIGRRAGWYAIIRAMRPEHVVETGTDKGLGSVVIASALLRNGKGYLTTMDINPAAGYFVSGPYSDVCSVVLGDSITSIAAITPNVGVFIHDADHSAEHESRELEGIASKLIPGARVLSDNAHATDSLMAWASQTNRSFLFFQERPQNHWYPGAGIGAAW